jgi:VCBS repeat-containing protein
LADSIPGDTSSSATINLGLPVTVNIDAPGDQDWYRVSLTAGTHYLINHSGYDPSFSIHDAAGGLVASSHDREYWQSAFLDFVPEVSADYFVAATNNLSSGDFQYQLSVASDAGETIGTSGPQLPKVFPITGYVSAQPDFDDDLYRVELYAGWQAIFRFNQAGLSEDLQHAYLQLFNASGELVETGTDQLAIDPAEDGTYYVSIGGLTASESGYYDLTYGLGDSGHAVPHRSLFHNSYVVPHTTGQTAIIKVFLGEQGVTTNDGYGDFTSLAWTTEERSALVSAFGEFERAIDVEFQFVTSIDDAQFVMLKSNQEPTSGLDSNTLGYWRIGGSDIDYGASTYNVKGIGLFNSAQETWTAQNLQPGGFGYITLVHELAHGLGLKHPHDSAGGGTWVMSGVDNAGDLGSNELNQGIYTTMTYNDGWETQPDVDGSTSFDHGWQSGLMSLDIGMLQLLYGTAAAQTGNTTYTLPGGNQPGTYFQTIWDTDGIDSIEYHGSGDATISLQAATLEYTAEGGGVVSYVKGIRGGFTIANGVWIENATSGSGDDWLQGSLRANILDGGAGSDTVDYSNRMRPIEIVLSVATAAIVTIDGKVEDTLYNIENFVGGVAADRLTGDGQSNRLTGGGGDDTIEGGSGNDSAAFTHSWTHYAISAAGGVYALDDDSSSDSDGTDSVSGVESFIFAGQQVGAAAALNSAPLITGNSFATGLVGTAATGSLLANASDTNTALGDTLTVSRARGDTAGSGFIGVSGTTLVSGKYGTLSLAANGAYAYTLDLTDPDTAALTGGMLAHDVFTFTVRDFKGLTAEAQLDVSIAGGQSSAPVITSNGGGSEAVVEISENVTAVTIVTSSHPYNTPRTYSLSGVDAARFTLNAATGVLKFKAAPDFEAPTDAGADNGYTIVVTASDGILSGAQTIAVFVSNLAGASVTGDGGNNTIDKTHAFKGKVPGSEEDKIIGRGGNDKLKGYGGNDTLIGGSGKDTLTGDAGSDRFVFNAKIDTPNLDTITDFKHNTDIIALDDRIFTKLAGSLTEAQFYAKAGATKAHDKSDRIVYDSQSGKLYYDDDGKGGHAAVQFAVLSNKAALDFEDFVIV